MTLTYCEKFMENVMFIEGPVSANILVPHDKTLPSILTLADNHLLDDFCDYCSKENGCLSLRSQSFFDSLHDFAIKEEITIDIFLETWTKKARISPFFKSVLIQNISKFKQFQKLYKSFRFHFTDIRKIDEDDRALCEGKDRYSDIFIFKFINFLIETFEKEDSIRGLKDGFENDNDLDVLIQILKTNTVKEYFDIPFIQESSRVFQIQFLLFKLEDILNLTRH